MGMHFRLEFTAFDLTNREVISCFGVENYQKDSGMVEDLTAHMRDILCNDFGFRFKLNTQILGDQCNPVQVRIVGYDANDDLAIIEATHVNAVMG